MKPVVTKILLCLMISQIAWGCAVHRPQQAAPPGPVPDQFQGQTEPQVPQGPLEQWWEVFNDARLNELMESTLENNLELAQAFSRLKQYEAIARQSNALRYPSVGADGSAYRARQLSSPADVTGDGYSLSLAAAFEVDLWNKLKSNYSARAFAAEASLEDIRNLYLMLSARTADLFYLLVEQRAQIAVTERTIAARQATVELVEQRYLEGMVSALDLYQARQTLAAAKARLPEFEATLKVTAHTLSILSGRYPDSGIGGTLAVLPNMPKMFPTGLPSALLTYRPDIQGDLLRLRAKDAEIAVAVAQRFPSINLLANYGYGGADFGIPLSGTIWNLAGNLTMPLLDWGRRKAEVERTEAAYQEQLDRYRLTVLTAFQEVEDALVRNQNIERIIQSLEEEEASAAASLRLSTARYIDGLSDYLPVLTAQALHFDAQTRLLSARRRLISARISLARALGGRWMDDAIGNRLKS